MYQEIVEFWKTGGCAFHPLGFLSSLFFTAVSYRWRLFGHMSLSINSSATPQLGSLGKLGRRDPRQSCVRKYFSDRGVSF